MTLPETPFLPALAEAFRDFDPHLHPRDVEGRFRRVLSALRPGERVSLPDGVIVRRREFPDQAPTRFTVFRAGTEIAGFDSSDDAAEAALRASSAHGAPGDLPVTPPAGVDEGDGWPEFSALLDRGSAGGTTGPRFAEDSAGNRYVVKTGSGGASYASPSIEHLKSEIMADELYRRMGVDVPEGKVYSHPETGKPVKVTRFVKGTELGLLEPDDPRRGEIREKLREGFAVDAWIGAWDVIGAGSEFPEGNVMIADDGGVYRLDSGGSLKYRGMGGLKPPGAFDEEVTELSGLRESPSGAPVFGTMTDAEIADQVDRYFTPERLEHALAGVGDPEVRETLRRRARWLRRWADGIPHGGVHPLVAALEEAAWLTPLPGRGQAA